MIEAGLWGLFAACSLILGATIAELRPPGTRVLGLVMAFGAGVLLSAISFELVEEAAETSGQLGSTFLGLFAGALVFTAGDVMIGRLGYSERKDIGGAPAEAGGLTIVLGTLLDGIPESAVLGLTLLETGDVGVAMLIAVFVSNVPEAIAATVGLRAGGWSLSKVYVLWSVIAVSSAIAAAAGYALLDGASPDTLAFMFAFAAGAMLTMLATSMMPEAFEHAGRAVGLTTVFGFAVAFGINWLEAV
jgi:ZIP family zinc transporter